MVGTHLELKTDAAAIEVHVGPEAFVTKQGFSFEKGDVITVTGSKQVIPEQGSADREGGKERGQDSHTAEPRRDTEVVP
jgi:hypothetical protein